MVCKKIKTLCLLILFFSSSVFSNPFVDVYGTDEETANKIVQKLGDDIHKLAQSAVNISSDNPGDSKVENIAAAKKKIIAGINEIKDFYSISFSSVDYYDNRLFTTVEVIEKNDHKRLSYFKNFSTKNTKEKFKTDKNLDQLLAEWVSYEAIGSTLIQKKGSFDTLKNCCFYHCLYGFEDEELKPFKKIFEREVPRNKRKLIETLRLDPDEDRRAHAAFLLGHIKEGSELINILTPSMLDPSAHVRNNVMRVLGSTLIAVKPSNFDMLPVIKMLDAPILTDRNKALFMLMGLSDNPKHKRYIIQNANKALMTALKMKQPNLHGNVHALLKKMSQKDFGERDYIAWQNWLDQEKIK